MKTNRIATNLLAATFALSVAVPAGAWAQSRQLPPCAVGMEVKDTLRYPATIVAIDEAKGSFQLRRQDGSTYWETANHLRVTFSCLHVAKGPAKTAGMFVGNWGLFTGSAWTRHPTDPTKSVYGPGGKSGGVTVRADGNYSWALVGGQTINGRWREVAAGQVARGGKAPAIVLTQGQDGYDWQMSMSGNVSQDNREQVSLDQLPGGVSILATRQ